tara:strand:- start:1227 stop:1862 length:636 start_codon:yes stop_codon:yes gene_type:complete
MIDYNLIDRILAIKIELESDIHNNVRILLAIKNILLNIDNYSISEINNILKEFYKLYPTENITDEIINFHTNENTFFTNNNFNFNNIISLINNNSNNLISIYLNNQSNESLIPLLNNFISNVNNENDVPIVIKDECFDNLEKKKYFDLNENQKENNILCLFSYENFDDDDDIIVLPCNHILKLSYGTEWLKNISHKCPSCRQPCGDYYAKI